MNLIHICIIRAAGMMEILFTSTLALGIHLRKHVASSAEIPPARPPSSAPTPAHRPPQAQLLTPAYRPHPAQLLAPAHRPLQAQLPTQAHRPRQPLITLSELLESMNALLDTASSRA